MIRVSKTSVKKLAFVTQNTAKTQNMDHCIDHRKIDWFSRKTPITENSEHNVDLKCSLVS
jgi:hypothetical protein